MQIADATAGALTTAGVLPAAEPLPSVYSVEKLPGGRYRIPNVPIFAEHERDLGDGKKFKADLPWLSRMVQGMRRREEVDKYAPAVHLGHHDPRTTDERPSVGILTNSRLKLSLYEDKPAWVAFADVVVDSEKDLKTLRKHRYRSVEIKNLNGEPKIDGLALLQSRSPYFKFPNLELAACEPGAAIAYEAVNGVGGAFHWPAPIQFADEIDYAAPGQNAPQPSDMAGQIQQLLLLVKQLVAVFNPSQPQGSVQPVMQAEEPAAAPLHAAEDVMDDAKRAKLAKKLARIQEELKKTPSPTGTMTYAEGVALGDRQKKLAKKQKKLEKKLEKASAAPDAAPTTYAEPPKPAPAPAAPATTKTVDTSVLAFATKRAAEAADAVRARSEAITWAETQLADRPTGDQSEFRSLLEAQYAESGRPGVEGVVSVMRAMLPSLPGPKAHADAAQRMPASQAAGASPAAELAARYSDDPIALQAIEENALYWAERPAKYRSDSLESFLNADPRMSGRVRPAPGSK